MSQMSYELFIAKRYLTARKRSKFISIITLISVGGVLVGVAALVIVLSVMNGFETEVRSRIIGTTSHITVFSIEEGGMSDHQEVISQVEKLKDVLAASPFVFAKAAIASATAIDGIAVRGILPEKEVKVTRIAENIKLGDFDLREGIGLGSDLAEGLGVSIGDRVNLFSLAREELDPGLSVPKVTKFKVTGIFETGMYEYDSQLAMISLDKAQKLFNLGDRVTGIEVRVKDYYQAGGIANELDRHLGYPYYAVDWMHQHKNLFSWMKIEKWFMFLVLCLIILVAAFNIISTLIMVVMEKTKEIGILKSMGATSKGVRRIFLTEGLVVGVAGAILGSGIGYSICWAQETFRIISLPSQIYFISSLPIDMHLLDFVLVAFASLGICTLASLYPAHKAAKLVPVEAIRYE